MKSWMAGRGGEWASFQLRQKWREPWPVKGYGASSRGGKPNRRWPKSSRMADKPSDFRIDEQAEGSWITVLETDGQRVAGMLGA